MFRRTMGALIIAATLGCTTFSAVHPREYVRSKRPPQVWVYRADSSVVLMRGPHFLAEDSLNLIGLVDGDYLELPLSEIRQVKAYRQAPFRTALVVTVGVASIAGAAILVSGAGSGTETGSSLKEGLP